MKFHALHVQPELVAVEFESVGGGSGRGAETESRSSARRAITYEADDAVNSLTE